jgi:hypothetical protein
MLSWLGALEQARDAAPTFAAMEAQIATPAEMRLYRGWRDLLARAEVAAKTPPAETAILREALRRQVMALRQTAQLEHEKEP